MKSGDYAAKPALWTRLSPVLYNYWSCVSWGGHRLIYELSLSALMENYWQAARALWATAQLIREECEQVFHLTEQITGSQWGGEPGLELNPHRIASFLATCPGLLLCYQRRTRTSQLCTQMPGNLLIIDEWLLKQEQSVVTQTVITQRKHAVF